MFETEIKNIIDQIVNQMTTAKQEVGKNPDQIYKMMELVIKCAFETKNIMFPKIVTDIMVEKGLKTTTLGLRIIEEIIAENN